MTTEIQADLTAQHARERAMADLGHRRAKDRIEKAITTRRGAETPAGVALAKRAIEPLTKAIKAFLDDASSGRAGRRHSAAALLKDVPVELAAYLTVKVGISRALASQSLKGASIGIAHAIISEMTAVEFEKREEALYRSIVRNAESRGLSADRIGAAVMVANRKHNVVETMWTNNQGVIVGTKLIELMIEATGVVQVVLKRVNTHSVPHLVLTDKIDDWVRNYNSAASLLRPVFMPTVLPPQPWKGTKGSPYFGLHSRFNGILTRGFKGQPEALEETSMLPVYAGLNAIQETPWRINRRVLEVMEWAWERNAGLSCLPNREDEQVPEKPQEVIDDVKGGEHRTAWRKLVRPIYERNNVNRSRRFEFVRTMSIAQDYQDEERIYFPHRLDFRGRCYAVTASLSPQGADHSKGLLEFAEGKPLGERGLFWLGVHGANLFGNDKVSLEERYQWSVDHFQMAREVYRDPLENLWWTEADSPWCFLAWCFEWAESDLNYDHVSRLPIALDGSCNGIQHFSAMLRDPVGGAAVNLVPADKPSDIYGRVAEVTIEKLKAEKDPEKQWVAQSWLAFGINRKITKRSVMVLPYGGTFKSCMEYTREAIREKINDGAEDPFGDALPKASAYLAGIIWSAISEVVIAAREAMSWLQGCARVANKANIPLRWKTPSGFVAFQDYKEIENLRIKTRFQGTIIKFSSVEQTDELDKHKQASAVSPNFVHSLDASAMMLTIRSCLGKGVSSFAMIHDSYGTHAADTDTLATTLREEFVKMYEEHDVLTEFAEELLYRLPPELAGDLPPMPSKGSLDLSAVLSSQYFFA